MYYFLKAVFFLTLNRKYSVLNLFYNLIMYYFLKAESIVNLQKVTKSTIITIDDSMQNVDGSFNKRINDVKTYLASKNTSANNPLLNQQLKHKDINLYNTKNIKKPNVKKIKVINNILDQKAIVAKTHVNSKDILLQKNIQCSNVEYSLLSFKTKNTKKILSKDLYIQIEPLIYQLNCKDNDTLEILFKKYRNINTLLMINIKCRRPQKVYLYDEAGTNFFVKSDGTVLSNRLLKIDENYPLKKKLVITSPFGYRIHPIAKCRALHGGTDLLAPKDTPIYSLESGQIIYTGYQFDYGKYVKITHNQTYETRYAHMNDIVVNEGDFVNKGDLIGYVGSTGMSTGPHLHLEILKDQEKIDPMQGPFYLDGYILTNIDHNKFFLRKRFLENIFRQIIC